MTFQLHGEIVPGPRIRAIKKHIGEHVLTTRATGGFVECQGVKLLDVTDAGFRGLEIVVEGLDAEGETIRRTLPMADLALWFLED